MSHLSRLTFLGGDGMRDGRGLVPAFAQTLDVDLLRLPQFPAVFALGDGATFLLDLEERTLGVVAGRGPVALDARLAVGSIWSVWERRRAAECEEDVPGVLLVVNENLSRTIGVSGRSPHQRAHKCAGSAVKYSP